MELNSGVFLDLATVDDGDLRLAALDRSLPAWRTFPATSAKQLPARIADAEVIVTNKVPLDQQALQAAKHLRLVVVSATGTDIIDLAAAKERGIVVCNVRDYCNASVAQHVLTLVLNLASGQPWYQQRVRAGDWSRAGQFSLHEREIREVSRLSIGIIGYGGLGQAVAKLARAVGMNILIGERRGRTPRANRLAFKQLVRSADVISLHCPLTDETRHMFDRDVFKAMKPDALLINTARGAIVHEADLAEALRKGEIGGAGLDVLSVEPPPADHPLLADDIPNLIITPHNAWASRTARQACVDQLAEIVNSYRRGQPMNRVV
jgi:glycerate dehydrogenase